MTNKIALPRGRSLTFTLLGLLLTSLLLASYATRGGDSSLEFNAPSLSASGGVVDQSPLETARSLAGEAATASETEYGRQALQVADHEVDQAFARALRQATEHAPVLKGAALATSHRIDALTQRVQAEQKQVASASQAANQGASQGANQGASHSTNQASPAVQLIQAQLALDQDELEDLQGDLIRAGGDRRALIQQALDQHEAVQKLNTTRTPAAPARQLESPEALDTMPGKLRAYNAMGRREGQLGEAIQAAKQATAALTKQHDALSAQTESGSAAAGQASAANSAANDGELGVIDQLHALASQRNTLALLDKQIHDDQQLTEIYSKWSTLVHAQRRMVLHRMVRVLIVLLVLVALMAVANKLIERLFERGGSGRRMHTMRVVLKVMVQLVGCGLILAVLFGIPRQAPTIIGLTTAGITVVMKDFIVAFFGWFVLMGRNGLRIGDWVEINGVSGEVIELGIMRTVLLETGSWNESAQPTGRQVTFMNSYAIEGQFFNFSTAGQWLWDELRVMVPAGPAAYEKVDAIRRIVEQHTQDEVPLAEQEWQRATRSYGARHFSATPLFELRPTAEGMQLNVRYIARAQDRARLRAELNEGAIGILHFSQGQSRERVPEPKESFARAGN